MSLAAAHSVFRLCSINKEFLSISKAVLGCNAILANPTGYTYKSLHSINFRGYLHASAGRSDLKIIKRNSSNDSSGVSEAVARIRDPKAYKMNKSKLSDTNSEDTSHKEMPILFDEAEVRLSKKHPARDIKFKTPYGHIACLEWGNKDAPNKILCVHGWLDNAGSFERLVPFILDQDDNYEKYHIVAMDLPGVGLSSHLPPGGEYSNFIYIMEMRRVTLELGWDKATFLVHSLGAHLTFFYSCVYPKQVERVIAIDLAYPLTRQIHNWQISIANSIEEKFKLEYNHQDDPVDNIRVPVYTETDALRRLMNAHSSSLTKESAVVLLKRGATKQSWGLTFNRDVRLRNLSLELIPDDEAMLQYLSVFRAKLLIIEGKSSPYLRPKETRAKFMDLFKRNCPEFRLIALEGTHHLHMNTPAPVAEEINKFLSDTDSDAQSKGPSCKGNL